MRLLNKYWGISITCGHKKFSKNSSIEGCQLYLYSLKQLKIFKKNRLMYFNMCGGTKHEPKIYKNRNQITKFFSKIKKKKR